MTSVAHYKLGKKPPRIDHRTLKLEKYIGALPAPPSESGYLNRVTTWPMYLNDSIGDCAVAAPSHMLEQWNVYAGRGTGLVTDHDVLKAYEAISGYNPADPSTDQGCVCLEVLKFWRKTGIGGHKIAAFVAVNPQNETEMKQALHIFGSIYIGLSLPISAQTIPYVGQNGFPVWQVPAGGLVGDGAPGSWGGHALNICGFGADKDGNTGTVGVTWGSLYDISWPFLSAYCEEAWAVLSPEWIAADGKSPSGFDTPTLLSDLGLFS